MAIYQLASEREKIPEFVDGLPTEFVQEYPLQCWGTGADKPETVIFFQYRYAVGLVVANREYNGYDDSDFMATYKNGNGEFKETLYASTRFPSQGYGANVDAPPELIKEYRTYLATIAKAAQENFVATVAIECNVDTATAEKIINLTGGRGGRYVACRKLLGAKLRSDFRKSLANQLRAWLSDDSPKYASPFSPKQWESLLRFERG